MRKIALLTMLAAAAMVLYFTYKAGAFKSDGKEVTAQDVIHEAVNAGERVGQEATDMLASLGL